MEGGARRSEGEAEERRSGQYTRNLQRIFHQEFRTVTSCEEDQVLLISTSTTSTTVVHLHHHVYLLHHLHHHLNYNLHHQELLSPTESDTEELLPSLPSREVVASTQARLALHASELVVEQPGVGSVLLHRPQDLRGLKHFQGSFTKVARAPRAAHPLGLGAAPQGGVLPGGLVPGGQGGGGGGVVQVPPLPPGPQELLVEVLLPLPLPPPLLHLLPLQVRARNILMIKKKPTLYVVF